MTASEELLRAVGREPDGHLGATADGVRPAVRDADGRRWALTIVPAGPDVERVRSRAEALAEVRHPHLVAVGPSIDLGDGSLAVLQAEVPGTDLAAVRTARGAWSPGEVVTVVVPLAEALAALHDAGLAHGDVAPGNVVLRPEGRPVLVDVVCAASPDETGTPGLAAPERPGGATPAADVYALGRLGALLLSGVGAAGGEGLVELLEVLTDACAIDPAHRPSARVLARRAFAACSPVAVDVPDAAVLARLTLRRLAVPDAPTTVRTAGRTRGRIADRATDRIAARVTGRAVKSSSPGGGRHRARSRPSRRALAVAAGAVLLTVVSGGLVASRGLPAAGVPTAGPTVGPVTAGPTPAAPPTLAAMRLTRARAQGLADGDPSALARLTVPGSPAWDADRAMAAPLAARGALGAVTVRVTQAVPLGASRCSGPVTVPSALLGPVRGAGVGGVGQDGRACTPVVRVGVVSEVGIGASTSHSAVVLVLRLTGAGWRVSEVEPYAP